MSTQTEIAIRPLTSFLGAEIEGVNASIAISTDVLTQLNDALIKHQLHHEFYRHWRTLAQSSCLIPFC